MSATVVRRVGAVLIAVVFFFAVSLFVIAMFRPVSLGILPLSILVGSLGLGIIFSGISIHREVDDVEEEGEA